MIRFAQPDTLYLLAVIPALGLIFWLSARLRRAAMERFGTLSLLARLSDAAGNAKRITKVVVILLAIGLVVVGLANPQVGTRMEEVKQEGIDLFIALDVSLSMKAEDIKPNRLEKARLELHMLIERLGGDRIGLIVFAGDAFTQFPLTTDYSAANLFLDAVDTDVVPLPGTNIAAAIEKAVESFDFEEPTTKAIAIITDGEGTEGDAFEAAKDAAEKGVLIYTIGLGSPAGAPIPMYSASGRQTDFKRDRMGNVVVTKLDEVGLEKLATIGNGKFFRATSGQDELEEIFKSLNALEKREFGTKRFTDYEDRFQYLLAAALLLLIGEVLLSDRRSVWIARWNPLGRKEEAVV
jgi:Ca-activated chloride channel family protein